MSELKYVLRTLVVLHKLKPEVAREFSAKLPEVIENHQIGYFWEELSTYVDEDAPAAVRTNWRKTVESTDFNALKI